MAFKIRRARKKHHVLFAMCALALIILIVIALLMMELRPALTTVAGDRVVVLATEAINTAVTRVLGEDGVTYNDLIAVDKDVNGRVTAIQTDVVKVNNLKAKLALAIQKELGSYAGNEVKIPLGTLTGSEFLAGRGPGLSVKLSPVGNVLTEITNQFDSAGINQTRHQLMLSVKCRMDVILPGYDLHTNVSTNVAVAETVIVGLVPEYYSNSGDLDNIYYQQDGDGAKSGTDAAK